MHSDFVTEFMINDCPGSRIWSSPVIALSYSFTVVSGIVTTAICLGGQKLIENSGPLNSTGIMISISNIKIVYDRIDGGS